MSTPVEQILTDKIFQFYYQKLYKNNRFEEFLNLKEKEQINFLSSLFLNLNETNDKNNSTINITINNYKKSEKIKFELIPTELLNKLKQIKNQTKKNQFYEKMKNFNILNKSTNIYTNSYLIDNNSISKNFTKEEEEKKNDLRAILNKYSNKNSLDKISIDTKDIQKLINNLENNLKGDLENYIREDEDLTHKTVYDQMNITNDNQINFIIPQLTSQYFKPDYYKCSQFPLEEINFFNREFYLIDNREIFVINNVSDNIEIKSINNLIVNSLNKSLEFEYKKISNPNRKNLNAHNDYFNNLNIVNKNGNSTNNLQNIVSYKNLNVSLGNTTKFVKQNNKITKDLILVNEPINQLTVINNDKLRKKHFLGRDLLDRIYFCPMNSVVVFDYNETNKLGILLLDYLRVESEFESIRNEMEGIIVQLSNKIEEDSRSFYEEKDKLIKEENQQKKQELVYEYMNNLKNKINMSKKALTAENNLNILNNFDNSINLANSGNPNFYTKKKVNNNGIAITNKLNF